MENIDGRLIKDHIQGLRFHIAGSSDEETDIEILSYAHTLIKAIVKNILFNNGGLIVGIGDEPLHKHDEKLSIIFDWTILEEINEFFQVNTFSWKKFQGKPIIIVGLPRWREKIPEKRRLLWEELEKLNCIELIQIKSDLGVGGILREKQANYGDILVTLGGGPGVNHLIELYFSKRRPIIPLDLPLNIGRKSASELFSIKVKEDAAFYLVTNFQGDIARTYSSLSLSKPVKIELFIEKFMKLILLLKRPYAFYVRLLNNREPEYANVDSYFRDVVDDIIESSGFERFESGIDVSDLPFLNSEIFSYLHYSSLVIIDLTGNRTNCFLELGYALGLKKKIILIAKEGTKLPFDAEMLPCHFWSLEKTKEENQKLLRDFMEKNILRKPIIS